MISLYAIVALTLLAVLVLGQVRIIARATRERKAGIGRFIYARDEAPGGFWSMLLLEWLGLFIISAYLLAILVEIFVR